MKKSKNCLKTGTDIDHQNRSAVKIIVSHEM